MKRLVLPILSLLAALAFQSCEGLLSDTGEEGTISVTPRTTSLSSEEGKIWVDIKASGKWTLSLDFGADPHGWATLSDVSGSGPKGDVRLSYEANEGESRSVTLVLVSGSNTATATVVQDGTASGPSGGQYGYDVAPSALDWLELPAMTAGDGRELLIHDMAGGKYKYKSLSGDRNWSCYWDYDDHESLWVAYPLNNSLKGSGSRSNAWGYDALLPVNLQPNITGGSYGGGWTRGHQLPSADRLKTVAANASTFVPTNMTPQDYDFNAGIWASLEGQVRNYSSKSDTLYVVTGALFDDSTLYTGSNTGFRVKVPTHYFKALLYKGSSSYATDGYMAAGFLLPHNSGIANGNYLDYIMSIDKLEEETGIDFFPNLIKVLGKDKADKIEATAPSSWWK